MGNIVITPAAIEKLKTILAEEGEGNSLRVMVMPGGHGLQYMLTAEKEKNDDDLTENYGGLQVIMDTDSAPLLEGAEIDYIEELTRTGFTINNPNAKLFGAAGGCACGGGACACGGGEHAQNQASACACGGGACACGGGEHAGEHAEAGHSHEGHAH